MQCSWEGIAHILGRPLRFQVGGIEEKLESLRKSTNKKRVIAISCERLPMWAPEQTRVLPLSLKEAGVILIAVFLSYLFVELAIDGLLRTGIGWFDHANDLTPKVRALGLVLTGIINPWVALLVIVLGLKGYFGNVSVGQLLCRFGFAYKASSMAMILAFAAGITINLASIALSKSIFTPAISASASSFNAINTMPQILQLGFAVSGSTIVPVVEEYLFRGILFEALSQRFSTAAAGIVVTIIFIAMHPSNIANGYWFTHLYFIFISVLLVVARILSKSLYIPVFLHSGLNFSEMFF